MATEAHCAFCFETLAARFEKRQSFTLAEIEELWDHYRSGEPLGSKGLDDEEEDALMAEADANDVPSHPAPRSAAISRLLGRASESSSSTSSRSSSSATPVSVQSSRSSVSLVSSRAPTRPSSSDKHPLFVTWNTVSRSNAGSRSLRGCIGTFEPQDLEDGLQSYALTSALEDHRFAPIPASLLPSLECAVTLLTDFSAPTRDPMDWEVGTHGIRISFGYHGRRYGATYLPDVAKEQGWTKEEAIVSLMRKAGWSGRSDEWRRVLGLELVRYQGKKVALVYAEWKLFRDWVAKQGVKAAPLN